MNEAEANKWVEEQIEKLHKEESIICPFCDHIHDLEVAYRYTSYYGMNGKKRQACHECGETFFVEEFVSRRFECTKPQEVNNDGA